MIRPFLKASVLGGLIVFLWSAVSWRVLPWNRQQIQPFNHDVDVAAVLDFATSGSGIFVYPGPDRDAKSTTGLMAFVSLTKEGVKPMGLSLTIACLMQMLGAFLVNWMLSRTQGLSYREKVLFITLFGTAIGWLGAMPNWIWWGFPASFTALAMADAVIGWTLAGLVIAKIIP
jgi:hypothetical protein